MRQWPRLGYLRRVRRPRRSNEPKKRMAHVSPSANTPQNTTDSDTVSTAHSWLAPFSSSFRTFSPYASATSSAVCNRFSGGQGHYLQERTTRDLGVDY